MGNKGVTLGITFLLFLSSFAETAAAHGGVFIEDDVCVIQIGFFRAHFTVYQPETSANQEFCEDIPDVTETLFVLDYLHDSLKKMPVDFRIIRDVTGRGRAASWEDISKLQDIEEHTVFYQRPLITSDATLTAEHAFTGKGDYIGIVTTKQPGNEKIYRAVFPFKVGVSKIGYLPLFIALILILELFYLYSNGTLLRWLNKLSTRE